MGYLRFDRFLDFSLIALFFSGAFNYLFAGTPLQIWKQLLVCIFIVYVLFFRVSNEFNGNTIVLVVVFSSLLMVVSSFSSGASGVSVFRNIFSYVAWVPFFFLGATDEYKRIVFRKWKLFLVFMVVGAVGLFVDLNSDLFSFMKETSVDIGYYLNYNTAKRSEFVFVASTLALPVISAAFVIVMRNKLNGYFAVTGVVCLIVSAISTGSFSAFFIAFVMLCATLYSLSKEKSVLSLFFVLFFVVFSFFVSILVSDFVSAQIERVIDNQHDDSEANYGRIAAWDNAVDVIYSFSLVEHVAGAGLGSGDVRFADDAGEIKYLGHGESSFFQAYIEGGFFGLILRLAPFVIFLVSIFRIKKFEERFEFDIAYVISTFVAIALAPTFGNVAYQAFLGLIVGNAARLSLNKC